MNLKTMVLYAMRESNDLYELFSQASELRDSIRNNEFNAQLDELHTVYEVDRIVTAQIIAHTHLQKKSIRGKEVQY